MQAKTAVAIRHIAFEDLGAFESPLREFGYTIRYLDIGIDEINNADADLLVVLGGPIGACEGDKYPFVDEEIRLLERRLGRGQATMGICLGAQLMARALDARVYPGQVKEIGFAPLNLTDAGRESCLSVFESHPVLHWHGDVFDLPKGAQRLASTEACANQAFAYGDNAIAFQFHPEANERGFERWLIGHTVEIHGAGLSVEKLRKDHANFSPSLSQRAGECIRSWLRGVNG